MKKIKQEKLDAHNLKNMNDVAVYISMLEGKKKQVDIAQIKEILKAVRSLFFAAPIRTIMLFSGVKITTK